jgi:hypothetical protein
VVASQQDIQKLQDDLKNLCRRSNDWLVLINVDKCKVMHNGYNNKENMKWKVKIWEMDEQMDLGVTMQVDLKLQ